MFNFSFTFRFKMNILIPMSGLGNRFKQAGYYDPKPLIHVFQKRMIEVVVDNLGLDGHYIFIVQKAHLEEYNLKNILTKVAPGCTIIDIDYMTEGAACTTLLAADYIDNDDPLIIANSDQYVEADVSDFVRASRDLDGNIMTFKATESKWSYAKVENDRVVEVAEKNPISDNATVGIYYWKYGSDYAKYAREMIAKDIRVNNEFYVCPVYNEAIAEGLNIGTYEVKRMWGLGTPEDLDYYLKNFKN